MHEAGFAPVIVDDFRNSRQEVIRTSKPSSTRELNGTASIAETPKPCVPCLDRPVHGAIHFAADKAVGESVEHPNATSTTTSAGLPASRRNSVATAFGTSFSAPPVQSTGRPRSLPGGRVRPHLCPPLPRTATPSRLVSVCMHDSHAAWPVEISGSPSCGISTPSAPIPALRSESSRWSAGQPGALPDSGGGQIARPPDRLWQRLPDARWHVHTGLPPRLRLAEAHVPPCVGSERNEGRLDTFNLGLAKAPACWR